MNVYTEDQVIAYLGAFTGVLMGEGLIPVTLENVNKSAESANRFWKKYSEFSELEKVKISLFKK